MKTSFNLPLGKEEEFFPIEIVLAHEDADRCFPCVYAPVLINAQDAGGLTPKLIENAWLAYENKLTGTPESTGAKNNSVIYITPDDDKDDGKPWVYETEELKLIRYGAQIVRVYGPQTVNLWEKNAFGTWELKEIDLSARQKLACLAGLNTDTATLDKDTYKLPERKFNSRGGFVNSIFDAASSDISINKYSGGTQEKREGRFCQQREKAEKFASYRCSMLFFGQEITRTYMYSGNQGLAAGNQITKIGRKSQTIREALTFSGDTEKRIKYWYGNPTIYILEWSDFIGMDGRSLDSDDRPNNLKPNILQSNYSGAKSEGWLRAAVPCWGTVLVEYRTEYTEYQFLYDFPKPKRVYEITAGNVEKVGYLTKGFTAEEGIVAWDTTLPGAPEIGELRFQDTEIEYGGKIRQHITRHVKIHESTGEPLMQDGGLVDVDYSGDETCEYDPESDEEPTCRKIALRLFFQLTFKPFRVVPFTLVATNGRQAAATTFTPPEPDFSDIPEEEVPKIAFFESRKQEYIYPDGGGYSTYLKAEHIEEIRYIDMFGKVTSERMNRSEATA